MGSPEQNLTPNETFIKNDQETPPSEGGNQTILAIEGKNLMRLHKKMMDKMAGIPTSNAVRKIALLALTTGVLNVALEKSAFATQLHHTEGMKQSVASETVDSQKTMRAIDMHPAGHARTEQNEKFALIVEDQVAVDKLLEKQGLVLSSTSLETNAEFINFNEVVNGVYTKSVSLRALDDETLELRTHNSDGTTDIVTLKDGDIVDTRTDRD